MGSVWRIPVCQGVERLKDDNGEKLHSTQKPEELLYRIIAISSQIGDLVFDPFGGTMTTGAMAKKLGRDYLCIDNNLRYCQYGQERIDGVQPEITRIATAAYDQRPPKVTFSEMIENGYFFEGEPLYYRQIPYLYLTKEGKGIKSNGEVIDIHSAIGKIKKNIECRLNGWDYWEVVREGKFIRIDEIRTRYLREVKHYE